MPSALSSTQSNFWSPPPIIWAIADPVSRDDTSQVLFTFVKVTSNSSLQSPLVKGNSSLHPCSVMIVATIPVAELIASKYLVKLFTVKVTISELTEPSNIPVVLESLLNVTDFIFCLFNSLIVPVILPSLQTTSKLISGLSSGISYVFSHNLFPAFLPDFISKYDFTLTNGLVGSL